MAKRIAKFEKVSFEQFAKDWKDTFEQYSEEEIRNIYDSLKEDTQMRSEKLPMSRSGKSMIP